MDQLRATFSTVDPGWMGLALVALCVRVLLAAVRWSFFTGDFEIGWMRRSGTNVLVGFALNNIFPFRAGDAARVWLGRTQVGGDVVLSGVLVFTEKLFDVASLVIFTTVGVASVTMGWGLPAALALLAFELALLPALLSLASRRPVIGMTWVSGGSIGLWARFWASVRIGASGFGIPKLMAIMCLSILLWGTEGVTYLLALRAVAVYASPNEVALVLGAGNLAGVVPALPGSWGTFELAAQSAMRMFGVDAAVSFSAAVLIHLTVFIPPTIVGAVIAGPAMLARRGGLSSED